MTTEFDDKNPSLLTVTLDESFELCQQRVRAHLGMFSWVAGNLPTDKKRHLLPILALMLRSHQLSDLHVGRVARNELLTDTREEMRNNLMEESSTCEYRALVDTIQRFEIPQQYLHDMVSSADMCIRLERFETFDQWLQFGCRLGGSTMLAVTHVLEAEKPGFEQTAMICGQSIQLTHLLSTICSEIQQLKFFMPHQDLNDFSIELDRLNPANPSKSVLRLIRLQVSRIEELFHEGGKIINFLDLDGRRMMSTVISIFWNMLMKIKLEPETILLESGVLSNRELLAYRIKHVLGIEGGVGVLPLPDQHHH